MLSIFSTSTIKTSLRNTKSSPVDTLSDTDQPTAQRAQMSSHSALQSPGASTRVGISNTGQQLQHQDLQVAQQHVQARLAFETPPPQSQETMSPASSPQVTDEWRKRQHQQLDLHLDYIMRLNAQPSEIERSRSDQGPGHAQKLMQPQSMGQGGPMMMPSTTSSSDLRPMSSRSLGNDDRVMPSQEWMAQLQRPVTPADQISPAYSPITPAQTPVSQPKSKALPSAQSTPSQQSALGSENQSTVKPRRVQQPMLMPAFDGTTGLPFTFEGRLPSPPPTLSAQRQYDATALTDEDSTDSLPKFTFPPPSSTDVLDFQSDPLFSIERCTTPMATSKRHQAKDSVSSFASQTSSVRGSAHSTRSSVDFGGNPLLMTPGTMAMDDLSLDTNMAVEETGISAEEVSAFIAEDFSDNKNPFACNFPGCGKRFGRRENIRSHVQTHLDDRQFRCLECDKRFVRQHDLKRHMKIHTKEKPYKCACGNGFARQDALTRHRQRGICKGSFEGIVRTPVKRGRPRKQRPNEEERLDKAARQRQRNANRAQTSSAPGSSVGPSQQPSPAYSSGEDMDMEDVLSDENIRLLRSAGSDAFTLESPDTRYDVTPPMSRGQSSAGSPHDVDDATFFRLLDEDLGNDYGLMGLKEPFGGPVEQGLGFNDEALFPDLLNRYN